MSTSQQPPARETPATPAQRRMLAALFAGLGLLGLAVLWVVVFHVAARYRLTCTRAASACVVVRERLGGDLTYRVAVSPEARAVVTTTRPRRGTPRVFLEVVTGGERTFLVEYQGRAAHERASAAAARLNALLAGTGAPVVEEAVGSPGVAWGLVGIVLALLTGISLGYRAVRARWGPPAPDRGQLPAPAA